MFHNALVQGLILGFALCASAIDQPVLTIPLVNQLSVPFLGSLIAYSPQSTVIRLGCTPSDLTGGDVPAVCAFNSTITYGPSTYALTVPNNDFGEGPTTVTCKAVSSTPQFCGTVEQQSTFAPIKGSESVAPPDLTTAEVTITAGADKLGPAASSFRTFIPASTTTLSDSDTSSATPSPTASGNGGGMVRQAGTWAGCVAGPVLALGAMAL